MKTVTSTILTAGVFLMMVGAAAAQAPEGVRRAVLITTVPTPPPPGTAGSALAVRERLLSFDTDKDLRLSRDELPERMQGLLARGDKNANGALDFDEIHALILSAASERTRNAFRPQPSEGLPGVISDLKLSPAKHEQALAIVHKLALNVNQPAGDDLYKAMRLLLDDEEYENFAAAAARLSKTAQVRGGRHRRRSCGTLTATAGGPLKLGIHENPIQIPYSIPPGTRILPPCTILRRRTFD